MLKFKQYVFHEIPVIPRFLTRFVKIPKAIDKILNRVGPLTSTPGNMLFHYNDRPEASILIIHKPKLDDDIILATLTSAYVV